MASQDIFSDPLNALHLRLGQEAWGHVVRRLLEELPERVRATAELLDRARVLDSHYVPTRYANGHPEGPPFEHYGELQSREAIQHADAIVDFCRVEMARPR